MQNGFNFCPQCNYKLNPSCPQCQRWSADRTRIALIVELPSLTVRFRRVCRRLKFAGEFNSETFRVKERTAMSLISEKTTAVSSVPAVTMQRPPVKSSSARGIFIGPNGLRAGWRLLVFSALFGGLFASATLIRFGGLQGVRDAKRNLGQTIHTPFFMSKSEAIALLLLCLATLVMGKIERSQIQRIRFALESGPAKGLLDRFFDRLSGDQRHAAHDVPAPRIPHYRLRSPRDGNFPSVVGVGNRVPHGRIVSKNS